MTLLSRKMGVFATVCRVAGKRADPAATPAERPAATAYRTRDGTTGAALRLLLPPRRLPLLDRERDEDREDDLDREEERLDPLLPDRLRPELREDERERELDRDEERLALRLGLRLGDRDPEPPEHAIDGGGQEKYRRMRCE